MKNLYSVIEGILDSDEDVKQGVSDSVLQSIVEFLGLDTKVGRYGFTGNYIIEDDKLIVHGDKNWTSDFRLIICDGKVANEKIRDKTTVDIRMFSHVYFNNVNIGIDTAAVPPFLANCNNCTITYRGFTAAAYKGLDKTLSKTKGNTIRIESTVPSTGRFLFDYSCISGLDLSNCRVILWSSAELNTIKNFKTRELIIQRGGKFDKDGPIFEVSVELSTYFIQKLDEFLSRNHITSMGMVDSFVQYIDWFVKEGNDYKIELLDADRKRVPKIK